LSGRIKSGRSSSRRRGYWPSAQSGRNRDPCGRSSGPVTPRRTGGLRSSIADLHLERHLYRWQWRLLFRHDHPFPWRIEMVWSVREMFSLKSNQMVEGSVCIGLRASCRVCARRAKWRPFETYSRTIVDHLGSDDNDLYRFNCMLQQAAVCNDCLFSAPHAVWRSPRSK
jgi:hypothetical protein